MPQAFFREILILRLCRRGPGACACFCNKKAFPHNFFEKLKVLISAKVFAPRIFCRLAGARIAAGSVPANKLRGFLSLGRAMRG